MPTIKKNKILTKSEVKEFLDNLKRKPTFLYSSYAHLKKYTEIIDYRINDDDYVEIYINELILDKYSYSEKKYIRITHELAWENWGKFTSETVDYIKSKINNSIDYSDFLSVVYALDNITVSDAFEFLFGKEKEDESPI